MANIEQRSSTLLLIGGASGVGKTTLARALERQGIAIYKKIHDLTLDIAREMNVDVKTAIEQMNDSVVIERLIALAQQYPCVVSDLHFAIQPRTDTNILATGKVENQNLLATEKYIPAFKVADLCAITNRGMILIPILLTCDNSSLVERRSKDTTRVPRSLNREIVQQECMAELEIYLLIMKQLGLEPQIFVNPDNQFSKLKDKIDSLIKSKTKR